MILALLNQKGGVGKTALALHIAGQWALQGKRVIVIDPEARFFRPQLVARFALNRCAARTVIAGETAAALADHDPPVLAARIGQRVVFADAARTGRLAAEIDPDSSAAREVTGLVAEIEGIAP